MNTVTTLLALLVLPIGGYELVLGRMLSGPPQRGVSRWLTTPMRIRIASLVYVGFSIALLLDYPPMALLDLIAGSIGLLIGSLVVLNSWQGNTRNNLPGNADHKTLK